MSYLPCTCGRYPACDDESMHDDMCASAHVCPRGRRGRRSTAAPAPGPHISSPARQRPRVPYGDAHGGKRNITHHSSLCIRAAGRMCRMSCRMCACAHARGCGVRGVPCPGGVKNQKPADGAAAAAAAARSSSRSRPLSPALQSRHAPRATRTEQHIPSAQYCHIECHCAQIAPLRTRKAHFPSAQFSAPC
jgi:hypothetical protein